MMKVHIFTGFERFWHWAQALLIVGLLVTGLEIHGPLHWLGFGQALDYHLIFAWTLIGLWVFAIFWHLATGEWRQYAPSTKGVWAMFLYYLYGMFSGEPKPYHRTRLLKHNPLQRLAYLLFKVLIAPALWTSGLLLMFYDAWKATLFGELIELAWVAWVHVAAVYALITFMIIHIYLASTTGTPWYSYLGSMFTGYEKRPVDDDLDPAL